MTTFDYNFLQLLVATTFALVLYMFLLRRLANMAQPIRLELASVGERLLASSISDSRKSQIKFYLENAFSGYIAAVAAFLFPFIAAKILFGIGSKGTSAAPVSQDDRKVALYFAVSIFVANPIFATILVLEVFILGLFLFASKGPTAVVAAIMATIKAERSMSGLRRGEAY